MVHLGFAWWLLDNPVVDGGPLLFAGRQEDPATPTLLTYGHGDVVRGRDSQWGDRLYGRGAADNKGQNGINLAALAAVFETRGRLGLNAKVLLITGEEQGSPSLHEGCRRHRELFAADVLIASDGPRVHAD